MKKMFSGFFTFLMVMVISVGTVFAADLSDDHAVTANSQTIILTADDGSGDFIEVTLTPVTTGYNVNLREPVLRDDNIIVTPRGTLDTTALGWYGVAVYRYPAKYQIYSPTLSVARSRVIHALIEMPNSGGKWMQGTLSLRNSSGVLYSADIGNYVDQAWDLSWVGAANVNYNLTYTMDFVGSAAYGEFYHAYYAE